MTDETKIKTATGIKWLKGWKGKARLYRLSVPMIDDDGDSHEWVIVSAVIAPFSEAETYIFPATPEGKPVCFSELPGSFRGGLDHETALNLAGYEVASEGGSDD